MNLSFVCFFNKCNCHKKYISKGNRTYPKTFGNISQGLSVLHSPDDNHLLAFSIQSIAIKHNLNAHIWFSAHSQHDIKSTSQECKDSQHPNDFIYLLSAFDYILGQTDCIKLYCLCSNSWNRFLYSDRSQTDLEIQTQLKHSRHAPCPFLDHHMLSYFLTIISIQIVTVI